MQLAAEAAWCAHDQGKFFEYERKLYEKQGTLSYSTEELTAIANQLNLDVTAFSECVVSHTHRPDLEQAVESALQQGVDSTPTFFINRRRLNGSYPYQEFQRIINAELATSQ